MTKALNKKILKGVLLFMLIASTTMLVSFIVTDHMTDHKKKMDNFKKEMKIAYSYRDSAFIYYKYLRASEILSLSESSKKYRDTVLYYMNKGKEHSNNAGKYIE